MARACGGCSGSRAAAGASTRLPHRIGVLLLFRCIFTGIPSHYFALKPSHVQIQFSAIDWPTNKICHGRARPATHSPSFKVLLSKYAANIQEHVRPPFWFRPPSAVQYIFLATSRRPPTARNAAAFKLLQMFKFIFFQIRVSNVGCLLEGLLLQRAGSAVSLIIYGAGNQKIGQCCATGVPHHTTSHSSLACPNLCSVATKGLDPEASAPHKLSPAV
jgi:hypothetical protein